MPPPCCHFDRSKGEWRNLTPKWCTPQWVQKISPPLHYLHEPPASFRFYLPLEMTTVRNSICAISKVSGINKENRKAVKNVQSFFTAFYIIDFLPAPVFTAFVPTARCTKILRWPSE
jgi:hypothetical protein